MKAGAAHSIEVEIRQASVADADLLLDLSTHTFYQAFAPQNSSSNMAAYMTSAFTREQLVKELKETNSVFFLAFYQGEGVGYAKLRKYATHTQLQKAKAVEIHRLYVLKSMIGKKIGKALMEMCLQLASQQGFEVIWLGVWEHNTHAIEFYKKWGFEIFDSYLFKLGSDDQTDFLMKKSLV
ncbi:GNAT family N-acetyltransferase [Rhodocytophaga rosea]|uniref:GNAT family N-acetyltransferase n=1 Tax=Rhodocytophaga rosea TaxID=2704465 RepID=A0A6C0GGX1_9BACT|nr:GNAT family N-acetyltransferase [Rhodocytophaga rosea]QHT67169.1 GNAT family N-acetyltransferase [Rhodocytophaga rosea]